VISPSGENLLCGRCKRITALQQPDKPDGRPDATPPDSAYDGDYSLSFKLPYPSGPAGWSAGFHKFIDQPGGVL
jgi:hypothetical protein